jgi:hypothetical protein
MVGSFAVVIGGLVLRRVQINRVTLVGVSNSGFGYVVAQTDGT